VEALMAHHGTGSIDILKKSGIVILLIAAMGLLHYYAVPSKLHPEGLLALGFLILAGYTIGELAETVKLPHITGYLLAGLLLGESAATVLSTWVPGLPPPFDEGILTSAVSRQIDFLNDLALALIALTAGGELRVESLKKGVRQILGVLGGQMLLLFGVMIAFTFAISGMLPSPFALDALVGLDWMSVMALGGVLAAIALATSPAATIAVINGTRSKGPLTDTVLSVVVLKDVVVVVLFSAATALAVSVVPGAHGGGDLAAAWLEIGGAMLLGGVVGFAVHLYLQYADREIPILLFLVGLIFTTTFVSETLHFHPALVFIAAGFVAANFSPKGGELIHEVERLSLPVYVVFFALAGAALHLDTLWKVLPLAVGLVVARGLAVFVGVRLGAAASGAPDVTRTYGWMGFLSQAGLAIILADDVKNTYPGEIGEGLFALLVGGVALNEIMGPVMFQWGLSWSGEAATQKASEAPDAEGSEAPGPEPHLEQASGMAAWGVPTGSTSRELNVLVDDLGDELRRLVDDIRCGPVADLRSDGEDYLAHLKRGFLRYHRRAIVYVQNPTEGETVAAYLRRELAELGDAWRDYVLDRMASRGRAVMWDPIEVVDALDGLVGALPESRSAWVEPLTVAPRSEGFLMRLRRRGLRTRVGLRPVAREVSLRSLARFHFSGRAPGELEALVALLIDADAHLAERTGSLFATISECWEEIASASAGGKQPEEVVEMLRASRVDLSEDFEFAIQELEQVEHDAVLRCTSALSHLYRELKADVLAVGTLDLPHRKRRYGRVYNERNRGLTVLTEGLVGARQTVVSRYAALALELELIGFEGRIREAVIERVEPLARSITGRGVTQLRRVEEAAEVALAEADAAIGSSTGSGGELARQLREVMGPLSHRLSEAIESVDALRDQFGGESAVGPLIQSMLQSADGLTEWCIVPSEKADHGAWRLPEAVPTVEIPFRAIAVGFIETRMAQDLLDASRLIASRIGELRGVLAELDRVVSFNVELASTELEDRPGEAIPEATLGHVREMVIGAVGRSRTRIQRMIEPADTWATMARSEFREAVVVQLSAFRGQILDGGGVDLSRLFIGDGRGRRRLFLRAEEWTGWLPESVDQVSARLVRALGEDRVEGARQALGLPATLASDRPLHAQLAAPRPHAALPVVYRRLFSDQALEAGDLLTGRQAEVQRLRTILTGSESGTHRNVALIGAHEAGVSAVANAALRGADASTVRRIALSAPVSVSEVDEWLDEDGGASVVVLSGLKWLFSMRPGGSEPLQRWVTRLIDESRERAWVVLAEESVWRYAIRIAPLDCVFEGPLAVGPLSVEDLSAALLARHEMSGYALDIEAGDDLAWQVQNFLLRGEDREARHQQAWFRTLHEASAGVMQDALRIWLASIRSVDDQTGTIRIGPVQRPPLARLKGLSDDVQLTLVQVLRQGWMSVELYALLFRVQPNVARARLGKLAHMGLLIRHDDIYHLAAHLRSPVFRVLQARGWA